MILFIKWINQTKALSTIHLWNIPILKGDWGISLVGRNFFLLLKMKKKKKEKVNLCERFGASNQQINIYWN